MHRGWFLLAALAAPSLALAQQSRPYEPVTPPPSTVNVSGGYGGWGVTPGTAAGSYMNGMASVISAAGDYNLSTSAAAVNYTQAQQQYIQNRMQATQTYFEMQEYNKAARARLAGPPPTMEQLTRLAREGAPTPLTSSDLDPVTGSLNWPDVLLDDDFADARKTVEAMYAKRASQGHLSYTDQAQLRTTINGMFSELKTQIKNIPTPEYLASRQFLQSTMYDATKAELQ